MPKPQEPLKDDPSRAPGAPPQLLPTSQIEKDRDGAMASVEVITRLLEELPNRRTTLRAADEGTPIAMSHLWSAATIECEAAGKIAPRRSALS
jgi:hypothetical protein